MSRQSVKRFGGKDTLQHINLALFLPGEMITSVWLQKVIAGTEMKVLQEGIPSVIPVEMCYLGWQESLEKLAKLVEPEIPDA